jgi:hypothetical protein
MHGRLLMRESTREASNVRMKLFAMSSLLVLGAVSASAQVTVPVAVQGNTAGATVELPGGLGVDLTIAFEQVVGLNPSALSVTASVVSPLDTSVLSRLPAGVSIPAAFPVLLEINPSAGSALTFQGVVTVSFHTHNLALRSDLPLSFFTSSSGGAFRDITRYEGIGSYRAGGSSGGFSEFLILVDTRNLDSVIAAKFTAVDTLLTTHAGRIQSGVLSALQAQIGNARANWQAGNLNGAIREVAAFENLVRQQSGAAIPDVWRAHDATVVNVAGQLRSAAYTLNFSLQRRTTRNP